MAGSRQPSRSASAAQSAMLEELAESLAADVALVVRPAVDADGNILHNEEVASAAQRASRVAARIAELSRPTEAYGPAGNRELAQLFVLSDAFVAAMTPILDVAKKYPRTVEDLYMPLGPALKRIEQSCSSIIGTVRRLAEHVE